MVFSWSLSWRIDVTEVYGGFLRGGDGEVLPDGNGLALILFIVDNFYISGFTGESVNNIF